MNDSIPMNKTLLNLCIYLQDTERQAISEGILIGNNNTDWYNATKKAYFGLDKKIFEEAGIKQNLMNLEALLYYKLPEGIRNTTYDQLHKFSFNTGGFSNCYQSVSVEKPEEAVPFISRYRILKSFIQGEMIKLSVDGVKCEYTFIRVSNTHLFVSSVDGKEEEIELRRILSLTL